VPGRHALVRFDGEGGDMRVTGWVERRRANLQLRFSIAAPAGAILVPPPVPMPARRDRLWEHTCCEAFIAVAGATAYTEINLAPSGDWNIYRFASYRSGMEPAVDASVRCDPAMGVDDGALVVAATIDLGAATAWATQDWDVSLTAVIEHPDQARSYWALVHRAAQPDFHQRASFCLRLPAEGHPA
jgi:hypothetical protein